MKPSSLLFIVPFIFLIILGCSHQMQTSFNEDELAPYLNQGSAKIAGQAFLTTRGGSVKSAAGQTVFLIPVCSYSQEFVQNCLSGLGKRTVIDPRLARFVRKCQADGSGNFIFTKVPPGNYYAACSITWSIPGNLLPEGGWVVKQITIKEGDNLRLILSS